MIDNDHLQRAGRIKSLMATYRESQDLINIGAYNAGSNPLIDEAIEKIPMINKFLQQLVGENYDMDRTLKLMAEIV